MSRRRLRSGGAALAAGALLSTLFVAPAAHAIAGSLQLLPPDPVGEAVGTATVFVTRSGGVDGEVSVDYAIAGGATNPATAGEDYVAPASGTLSWADQDASSKPIEINIVSDSSDEVDETVLVSLTGDTATNGATIGDPSEVTLTIVDDDEAGSLQFSAAEYTVRESQMMATIAVSRVGGADGQVSVRYSTAGGSATPGDDYAVPVGDTLEWLHGDQGDKTFVVPIVDDVLDELDETVLLSLSDPQGGAVLGGVAQAQLVISDGAGAFRFSSASFSASEVQGSATISVERVGDADTVAGVTFATANGTAGAPGDYGAVTGSLVWAIGEAGAKTFTVPIVDDSALESAETVLLTLSNPTGEADLGAPATATLTITDTPGGVDADQFFISQTPLAGLTIDGREGSDSYRVDLGNLAGVLTVSDTGASGTDTLVVNATNDKDFIQFLPRSDGSFEIQRDLERIILSGIEGVTIDGAGHSGDRLYVETGGRSFQFGSVLVDGYPPIEHLNFETIDVAHSSTGSHTISLNGYWVLDDAGGVFTFGNVGYFGSIPGLRLAGQRIPPVQAVNVTSTATGLGYWVLDEAGGVFTFGDARFFGSIPGLRAAGQQIGRVRAVDVAMTPSGRGYYVLDEAGGVFTFGDARFFGSIPGLRLAGQQIGRVRAVDVSVTPSGRGYYVLDEAGGVFTFGDARFFGSIPGLRLAGQQIPPVQAVDVAVTPSGRGYWVLDEDGGVFTFGDARYHGSVPGLRASGAAVGSSDARSLVNTFTGAGYWVLNADGRVFSFGDAKGWGSLPAQAAGGVDLAARTLP